MAPSPAYRPAAAAPLPLLPAQNATGNWIKIVQRLPVRILLDPAELKANPLRVGLSATVDVDVSDSSGSQIGVKVRNQAFPAQPATARTHQSTR